MSKIKEVLRLRNELKLDQRKIARSCSISVSTVHEYLKRAEAATVGWPLPEGWDDARLDAVSACRFTHTTIHSEVQPAFAAIHERRYAPTAVRDWPGILFGFPPECCSPSPECACLRQTLKNPAKSVQPYSGCS